jgi:hypothetical protein
MGFDDIIARNKKHAGRGSRHPLVDMVASELNDPTADASDIRRRILAMVIVVGVLVAIVVLVKIS